MPGLLRGIARTAVVAGTATAVSNRVSRRQLGRWSQQAEAEQPAPPPQAAPPPPPAAPPPPPAADPMQVRLDQLKQLAELKKQGLLTDEELERQKAQILGS